MAEILFPTFWMGMSHYSNFKGKWRPRNLELYSLSIPKLYRTPDTIPISTSIYSTGITPKPHFVNSRFLNYIIVGDLIILMFKHFISFEKTETAQSR